jgi:non-specific protein-tyrosine kinase
MLLQDDAPAPLAETPIEGLRLLPSGPVPPNPSELLASRRLEGAIERLKDDADLVLFDSPPALAVSDAAVLSRRVDGVVLVVSAGRTRREHAARARQVLERAGARLLGVVLNNASLEDAVYSYGS